MNRTIVKGLFITGTDTGVGKTWIGTRLVEFLLTQNQAIAPRKPVESGCLQADGQFFPQDALAYHEAIHKQGKLETICPFRFSAAVAPPVAAKQQGTPIFLGDISQHCIAKPQEWLIVEGAGGFYSPIAEDGLNSDLADQLQLPVLLIATDKLGCINHILLTLEAIHQKGLKTLAVVLNKHPGSVDTLMNNAAELKRYTDTPILNYTVLKTGLFPQLHQLMENSEQKKGQ